MSDEKREYRVAAYVRVASDTDMAREYNLYEDYYNGLALSRCHSKVLQYYVDKGLSVVSPESREAYRRLLTDCKVDKYDLILTKSISRFGANIQDCIETCKMLRSLDPPVEVYFDIEGFSTFSPDADMRFAHLLQFALAEKEAKDKSIQGSFHRPYECVPQDVKTLFYHRRKDMGLTQAEVAQRANVSLNRYRRYEKGIALAFQSKECAAICEVLEIEPTALKSKKTFAIDFMKHRDRTKQ